MRRQALEIKNYDGIGNTAMWY